MSRSRKAGPALALCAVVTCLLTLGVTRASADSITYDLTVGNAAPGLGAATGPYAQVTVDLTSSTTATITFDSLTNGGFTYLLGDGGTAGANVNGAYTLGTVTETNSLPGFTPTFSANSPGNEDGFGNFDLSLNNFDGFTSSATEVSFNITLNSGTWSSASNVLTPNNDGEILAMHGFACAEPGCNSGTGATYTGFASGANEVPATPEPASMVLMGTFLLGAAMLLGRKLKSFESEA